MNRLSVKRGVAAAATALLALTLAACAAPANESSSAPSEPAPAASAVDLSSMSTLGDVLAIADSGADAISYGSNDDTFVCVVKTGGSTLRAVCDTDPSRQVSFADLDMEAPDYKEQIAKLVGDYKLRSVEDITANLMSQSDVDAFVGKTGKDLIDAGFVFQSYFMYGGEQTGAEMAKEFYSYNVTFDTQVSEDKTEDGGASIMDAKIVEIQSMGNLSNFALDPETAE